MKFGMTSTLHPEQPNVAIVSRRRYSDTAVVAVERSIENLVMAWYDGSWPTIVMSVPWSVVTTGTSSPPARSISRAIQALVACGIA
jgi:hypothetical protein